MMLTSGFNPHGVHTLFLVFSRFLTMTYVYNYATSSLCSLWSRVQRRGWDTSSRARCSPSSRRPSLFSRRQRGRSPSGEKRYATEHLKGERGPRLLSLTLWNMVCWRKKAQYSLTVFKILSNVLLTVCFLCQVEELQHRVLEERGAFIEKHKAEVRKILFWFIVVFN